MQIIEVVLAVATPEDINLSINQICSVHVAWTRCFTLDPALLPFLVYEVQDVQIIGCEGTTT